MFRDHNLRRQESLRFVIGDEAYVGPRVKDFSLLGENPKVHFLLNKPENVPSPTPGQMMTQLFPELRTEDATDEADTLFYAAKEIIVAHQQTALTPFALAFTILLAVGFLTLGFHQRSSGNFGQATILCVIGVVDLVFILIWSNRRHYLTLDTRLESPSFLEKYKEEFAKQAVTATISAAVGVVIGYLLGRIGVK
jgi:hypothetical protein